MGKYKVKNKRLAKYLYSLGFNRESFFLNGNEYWLFDKNDYFDEALNFYFYIRERNRR